MRNEIPQAKEDRLKESIIEHRQTEVLHIFIEASPQNRNFQSIINNFHHKNESILLSASFQFFRYDLAILQLNQPLQMIRKIIGSFSTKDKNFFWTQINPCVKESEYAVRGVVPTLANTMQTELKAGKKFLFDELTFCNIGNPQEFHQKPITYFREVLSCALNPALIDNPSINLDARNRAKAVLKEIISTGSYTHSLGIPLVRANVCKYIARMDKVPEPKLDQIFLTEGASQGVHLLFSTLIMDKNDAIMIPIPQYPLYTASIALNGGSTAPYYLNESKGWQLDLEELESSIKKARSEGKNIKSIVIINPGNPTGSILSRETIAKVLEFSVKNKLVVIADEVYRENVYKQNTKFVSFREVLETLSPEVRDNCELASLHSVSKGLLGECGARGGYLYLHNFNPDVTEQLVKLKSINLCSNSIGQLMVDLMVNPLQDGVSQATRTQFESQYKALYDSLKYRARLVTKALNGMKNINCQQVQGAMYAFPSVKFSDKAIAAATQNKQNVDLFYCLEVLKNTGVVLVPGSGFRQYPGTYHFRITTLILPEAKLQAKLESLKKFNEQFHKKYE